MKPEYDFSGWLTRYDIKCDDGRTIKHGAFSKQSGKRISLVWQHQHNSPENVLGFMDAEARPEGIYGYGSFNNSDQAVHAKNALAHGDYDCLSIFANKLQERDGDVYDGVIREVSLCVAGANPGARIDHPVLMHDGFEEPVFTEAVISMGGTFDDNFTLMHSATSDDKKEAKEEPKKDEEEDKGMADKENKTLGDVIESMNEDQKAALYYLMAKYKEELEGKSDDDDEDKDEGDDEDMKHSAFMGEEQNELMHDAIETMENSLAEAKRNNSSSLRQVLESAGVLQHDGTSYGITNVETLFPDAKNLTAEPQFIKRRTEWVKAVMEGVHSSPFSRVKSTFADITEDAARARGYIKATQKVAEFFNVLNRVTEPQTVYKLQKMDRDDILDITDFNVVAWIKDEMRGMLDEELARAVLVGDGRTANEPGKIREDKIRPIAFDDDLFTIKVYAKTGADDDATTKNIIRAAIIGSEDYEGSGNKVAFVAPRTLTNALLLEDGYGRERYTRDTLASKLNVSKIVESPIMKGVTDANGNALQMVIVDLHDYVMGADKGGSIQLFEDFDIDFNQNKYLIETRCSGALEKIHSAIAVFSNASGNGPTYTEAETTEETNPKAQGLYERTGGGYIKSNDTTVVTGKTYYSRA